MSLPVAGADYVTSQLVAATNQTATTLIFASPTEPWPVFDATHLYFYITLVDEPSYIADSVPPTQREIFKVSSYAQTANGWELTGVRGSGGTTAQIWAVGAVAEIRPCAQWLEDLKSSGGGGDVTSVSSTDVAITIAPTTGDVLVSGNDFVGSGIGHAHGLVPDPGAVAGTDNYLREDGTWATPPGGGGGAPVDATYVVMSLNGTLTDERVLTAGTGITITDGGANSTVTISATSGGFSKCEEFLASGTFTPESGVTCVWLTMIGAGGGGSNNASSLGGGGGGSGEYCVRHPIPISGAVAVTVGAAGTGAAGDGSGHAGGDGGDCSFGSTFFTRGGKGGSASSGISGAGGGVSGGTASVSNATGKVGIAEAPTFFGGASGGGGGATTPAAGGPATGNAGYPVGAAGGGISGGHGGGGAGATSPWGLGGVGGDETAGASASTSNYGAGGGGASGKASGSFAGGNGAPGYVIVEWIG